MSDVLVYFFFLVSHPVSGVTRSWAARECMAWRIVGYSSHLLFNGVSRMTMDEATAVA